MLRLPARVILIGPSGSGKSVAAHRVAAELGYQPIDTDAAIVERIGMPIAEFFARFGEPSFRALESEALAEACAREGVVIATGGGVVLAERNWLAMRPGSAIVGLSATPETLVARVRAQAARDGAHAERPLLAGDAVARLRAQLVLRGPLYAHADATIDTERHDEQQVARAVIDVAAVATRKALIPDLCLGTSGERSDIHVAHGIRRQLPTLLQRRWPRARRVWVIADRAVAAHWSRELTSALEAAGIEARLLLVEPGERSKSFAEVTRLCDELTRDGVSRRDVVIALGGGVAGDLAGFVAAICLRGLALVQLPTSLLAMVDSSVGGKTGVNMAAGKNLAGAFYQPGLVLIDPDFLTTLPRAEYRSGMAEVVKHALIQPATPLGGTSLRELLADAALDPLPVEQVADVLRLNVRIKHSVVQADERESGLRMILNYGHTAGHAIEADGYRYRHGEAIAIGMAVAARIARLIGRIDESWVGGVEQMLARAGLPVRFEGDPAGVIGRLAFDKKNVDGAINWILPGPDGRVERVTDVPGDVVRTALAEVGSEEVASGSAVTYP